MSVHGIYVLIVFNGRRTHAWFKQILKMERMFFPVVDKNRVSAEGVGSPGGRVSRLAYHQGRPARTCCSGAPQPWHDLLRLIQTHRSGHLLPGWSYQLLTMHLKSCLFSSLLTVSAALRAQFRIISSLKGIKHTPNHTLNQEALSWHQSSQGCWLRVTTLEVPC